MKFKLLILFSLLSVAAVYAQHWESIVQENDTWRYQPATSSVAADWYKTTFSDISWSTGIGGFGFGDGDDKTLLTAVNSVYLRRKFPISNLSEIKDLILDIDYDDAFVCYLNDVEVARSSNLTANPPVYNSGLTIDHEALIYQGKLPERYFLKVNALKEGENLISVQVLNASITSSDLSARVFLNAKINNPDTIYNETPFWFVPPISFTESNLPILAINTNGGTIVDEPKITAQLKVINHSGRNALNDTTYEYNGNIGIEIRGSSSQDYAQKSYALETRTSTGENLNVKLLGMHSENDWVLYGPYVDKTMLRNVLTFDIGNKMGRWAPHTRFCELFINEEYRGVYVLMENIKVDKHRVDIATLRDTDLVGDQLTGGYIMKIDREDPGFFNSRYADRSGAYSIKFSYVEPEYAALKQTQRDYIRNYIHNFEAALFNFNYTTFPDKYLEYSDMESFVDYFIVQELAKNVDAYRLSAYFHKDKDSKGGKLTMGPLWDFNFTFGLPDYLDGWQTTDWVLTEQYWSIPFWWDKLRVDPRFNSKLKRRWTSLRQNILNADTLMNFIDVNVGLLSEAQVRQFTKYPILKTYVWPDYYIGGSYVNEINFMKTWIKGRLTWIDGQMAAIKDIFDANNDISLADLNLVVSPNPSNGPVHISFTLNQPQKVIVQFFDLTGKQIEYLETMGNEGINHLSFDFGTHPATTLFYKVITDDYPLKSGKIILLQ